MVRWAREAGLMLFGDRCVVIRGGGDLATGAALRLVRAGFPVIVTELEHPMTVRTTVSFSTAVSAGRVTVEGVTARRTVVADIRSVLEGGDVPVLVSPSLPDIEPSASVVVDARMAKRNIDTAMDDAPLVVALGPGFTAGSDCDVVIETARGHRLGRVIWTGAAEPNTGTPGLVGGKGAARVLRSPAAGMATWQVAIGDVVIENQPLGTIGTRDVVAPFDGLVRGLIAESTEVPVNTKIGDIDPRVDPLACEQVSDKSLAIGGGVLEAVMTWLNRSS